MRIAILQYRPHLGDFAGNLQAILHAGAQAKNQGCDLLVTSELALCGYPPRDLLLQNDFLAAQAQALQQLQQRTPLPLLVGCVIGVHQDVYDYQDGICNGAVLLAQGQVQAAHRKILLPNYDIFDEKRYFTAGQSATITTLGKVRLGILLCEDSFYPTESQHHRQAICDPVVATLQQQPDLLINLSASPFEVDKLARRQQALTRKTPMAMPATLYVNQVGGYDGIVFDGHSAAYQPDGSIGYQAPGFCPHFAVLEFTEKRWQRSTLPPSSPTLAWGPMVIEALCTGLRDYVRIAGAKQVLLGLSGGIDSAVTACIARLALGSQQVMGISLPSRYTQATSRRDAHRLAESLGIGFQELLLEPLHVTTSQCLQHAFESDLLPLTAENIQSRLRGLLLMSYANQQGALLLSTANKSEIAVGYCTLYGDTCGALAVLGDVFKSDVYYLAQSLQQDYGLHIPSYTLARAPSAELREAQTDQDSLPPYPVLDTMLQHLIGGALAHPTSVGLDEITWKQVVRLIEKSEYKRRQLPPTLRISRYTFGEGWRWPLQYAAYPRTRPQHG